MNQFKDIPPPLPQPPEPTPWPTQEQATEDSATEDPATEVAGLPTSPEGFGAVASGLSSAEIGKN